MYRRFSPGVTVTVEHLDPFGETWVVWPATWPDLFGHVDPAVYRAGSAAYAFQWHGGQLRLSSLREARPSRAARLRARIRVRCRPAPGPA